MLSLFERLGRMTVDRRAGTVWEIEVELPLGEGGELREALRAAASGDVTG